MPDFIAPLFPLESYSSDLVIVETHKISLLLFSPLKKNLNLFIV